MSPTPPVLMDAYVRVSRKNGRDGEGYISPKVQREAIERWAEYKGVTIAEWHVDEDESGGTHDRPGLKRAVERCLNRQTGGVVSWKIDRFSRNTEEGLRELRTLDSVSARLAFVVEDLDTGTTYGRMIYTILLAVSEAFLGNITAGLAAAQLHAVERGAFVGPTPFGYLRIKDKRDERVGCLVEDPKWGPVVRAAFKVAARDGMDATVEYLREHAPHRQWRTDEVRKLMRSRAYLGEAWITVGEKGNRKRRTNHVAHVALAELTVWTQAQTDPRPRRANGAYPLSGIATCADCGESLKGGLQTVPGRTPSRRYRCTNKACPGEMSIAADALENHVRAILRADATDASISLARPGGDDREAAEAALHQAESNRRRLSSNVDMLASMSDEDAAAMMGELALDVDAAAERYRAACAASSPRERRWVADELGDPEHLALAASDVLGVIAIGRGRRAITSRVVVRDVDGVKLHLDDGAGMLAA